MAVITIMFLMNLFSKPKNYQIQDLPALTNSKQQLSSLQFIEARHAISSTKRFEKLLIFFSSTVMPYTKIRVLLLLHATMKTDPHVRFQLLQQTPMQCKVMERTRQKKGETETIEVGLVEPYVKFLKKIAMSLPLYKGAISQKYDFSTSDQCIEDISFIINLLKAGCQMNKFMRRYGRYFIEDFTLLFNIYDMITGQLRILYNHCKRIINKIFLQKNKLEIEQSFLVLELIRDFQSIRDSIMEVAFNRYYQSRINHRKYNFQSFELQSEDLVRFLLLKHRGEPRLVKKLERVKQSFTNLDIERHKSMTNLWKGVDISMSFHHTDLIC